MRELYVYYRVPHEAAAAARAAVAAAHAALRARHRGLVARLLRRADAADPARPDTWMETYALPGAAAGVDAALEAAIEAAAAPLAGLIEGRRHVEAFVADEAGAPPASMKLGAPAATAAPERLGAVFLGAPVPSGCTLTMVESRLTASMRTRIRR